MGQVVTRDQVVFVGGVANNTALAKRLEAKTGHHLLVPQEPQLNGAYGAALFSLEFTRR